MFHKPNSTNHLDKAATDSSITRPMPQSLSIILTLAIVILIREVSVTICQILGYVSAANIVGMIALFLILILWRYTLGLPQWMTSASNTLLVDSGFAFLPVSAGAGILLFALGDEFWGIMLTIIISTLLPLWGLAHLSQVWLKRHDRSHKRVDDVPRSLNITAEHKIANDKLPDDK